MSRNPVREALSLLARDGWVDLRARHGAHVHSPTRKEVEDFFRVRMVLESDAAALAAANATEEAVAELRRRYEAGVIALRADDEQRMAQANSSFHAAVMEIADNRVLDELLGMLKKRLRWYFSRVVRIRGPHSWEEHAGLLEAIASRQVGIAADLMRHHCQATAIIYRSAFEDRTGR